MELHLTLLVYLLYISVTIVSTSLSKCPPRVVSVGFQEELGNQSPGEEGGNGELAGA